MRRNRRLTFLATAVMADMLAYPGTATAYEPPESTEASSVEPNAPSHDADVEEARALFRRGVALAQTTNWEDALSAFERSNQLRPHAVTLYNIAFCEEALGQYTRATRDFEAALDESPGVSRLPPELEAMARRDLRKIAAQLSTAVVAVRDRNDRLLVDGRPLAPAGVHAGRPVLLAGARDPGPPELVPALTLEVRVDPGTHVFRLFHEDEVPADVARTLRPAESTLIELPLPAAPSPPREVSRTDSKRTAAYWVLGGAAAGAVVAGTFGTLALIKRSELAAVCPGHVCEPQYASDVSHLGLYSDLTTGGLVVAVAGLAVGGFLLATSNASSSDAKAHARYPVDVRFSLGRVRALSVEGVF